jgi:DNA-directed RNA polymerase specialized sigma24 family protein
MTSSNINWPPLPSPRDGYTDEFGVILPEVYKAVREIWPQTEHFVRSTLGDLAAGQHLMFKAAATVSRQRSQNPDLIKDLNAYLRRAFKRLVLDELEKETGHRDKLEQARSEQSLFDSPEEDLDRKILIQQLVRLMDDWTREVFLLLAAGYDHEEIAAMRDQQANAIRSRFSKQLKKIRERLQP